MLLRTVGAVIVISSLSSVGVARQPDAFDRCALTKDPAARLACFDGAVAARRAANSPRTSATTTKHAPVSNTTAKAPAPTANRDIGLSGEQLRQERRERGEPEPPTAPAPAAIVARVVRVIPRGPFVSAFELDNGEIWEQSEAKSFSAEPREEVTIRPGVLGSFFLKNADGAVVRVHRVK